jgi:hypothetical protein
VYGGSSPGSVSLITSFDASAPATYTDHNATAQHHDYFAVKAVDYSEHRSASAKLEFNQTLGAISTETPHLMFSSRERFLSMFWCSSLFWGVAVVWGWRAVSFALYKLNAHSVESGPRFRM